MIGRYKYSKTEIDKILNSMVILVDTREHEGKNDHILNFFDSKNIQYKKLKLDQGDYSFYLPKDDELCIFRDTYFDKEIIVERKNSLEEISGNMANERSRIKTELALAPPHKILLIENGSYKDIATGNYKTQYDKKSFLGSIHSLWHEFELPVVFMPDNNLTGLFIVNYFRYYLGGLIK